MLVFIDQPVIVLVCTTIHEAKTFDFVYRRDRTRCHIQANLHIGYQVSLPFCRQVFNFFLFVIKMLCFASSCYFIAMSFDVFAISFAVFQA
jgi:hypothetical protein